MRFKVMREITRVKELIKEKKKIIKVQKMQNTII